MKKVSFLVLAGTLTFILSGCGDGGVAHSLKEVCDNPNTKYDKLEADIIYEMIDIDLANRSCHRKRSDNKKRYKNLRCKRR